jgi:nucleotide-binding universal stress UspA family protein
MNPRIRRIHVAIRDVDQPPRSALRKAASLARATGAVFNDLAPRAGVPARRRHLRMGETTSQMAGVTRRIRAAIIVMGAVSRSALSRAFIGNTAESALDALNCDVLVVKPRGFRTRETSSRSAFDTLKGTSP